MTKRVALMAVSLTVGAWNIGLKAGEHPQEHPTGSKEHPTEMKKEMKKEHPKEHPQEFQQKSFQDSYEKVVKDYVASESQKTGGVYTIKDEKMNKDWKLELKKVHKSKICMLQEGKTCFACADFKEVGGKTKIDLDFYAKKDNEGNITMEKALIHKVNGKPRFTYDKDNNMVEMK